jgi:hypothetical protein
MESRPFLLLDTILSALENDLATRDPQARETKRWRVCRYLMCRLYDQRRGNLMNAALQLAQVSIAKKLGISLRWVHELAHRLAALGWLEFSSEKLPDGTNGSTIWRIGPKIKRLLVALSKSKQRKSPIKSDTHSRWNFSPLRREKEILRLLKEENAPPTAEELKKLEANPLLKVWLERGKEVGSAA